jgi:hypothetical protein
MLLFLILYLLVSMYLSVLIGVVKIFWDLGDWWTQGFWSDMNLISLILFRSVAVFYDKSSYWLYYTHKWKFKAGNGIIRIISILYIQLYSIICMYNLYKTYNKIFEFNGQNHETKVKVFWIFLTQQVDL